MTNTGPDSFRRNAMPTESNSRPAVPTGFEPAISSLTGTYARPLHHGTMPKKARFRALPSLHYEEKEAASALPFTRRPAGVAKLTFSSLRGVLPVVADPQCARAV
jgi:hypothetical protein